VSGKHDVSAPRPLDYICETVEEHSLAGPKRWQHALSAHDHASTGQERQQREETQRGYGEPDKGAGGLSAHRDV